MTDNTRGEMPDPCDGCIGNRLIDRSLSDGSDNWASSCNARDARCTPQWKSAWFKPTGSDTTAWSSRSPAWSIRSRWCLAMRSTTSRVS